MTEKSKYEIDTEKLPFADVKQRALVGHALKNEKFFAKVIRTVKSDWFHDQIVGRVWKNIKHHHETYGLKPTVAEVKECPEFMGMVQAERQKHTGVLDVCVLDSANIDTKVILNELVTWYRARILQIGVPVAADLYNSHKIEEAAAKLKETMKDFQSAGTLEEREEKFGNVKEEFTKTITARENALTIGNAYFDHILDEKCPLPGKGEPGKQYGSLHKGELSVVLAPTSAGKSTLLVTTCISNIKRGKRILYVSHEDPKLSVKMNMRKAFACKDDAELQALFLDPTGMGLQWLNSIDAMLGKGITYLPMNRVGLTVEEVMDTINQFQEREVMEMGKGFDMVIDDYPSRLVLARGGKWEKRQVLEEIYQQFGQLALDIDVHCQTAMQVNREGNKINKRMGNYEKTTRLVTLEDASEAFGPMTAARLVITINRTPFDKQNKQVTFLCCKTKQGESDYAITLDCDYARSLSFKPDSRCFWYRGDVSLAKFAEEILKRHSDGSVVTPQQVEDQRVIQYLNLLERGDGQF